MFKELPANEEDPCIKVMLNKRKRVKKCRGTREINTTLFLREDLLSDMSIL